MKIHIVPGSWVDAIRIELHLSIVYEDNTYHVDKKYENRVQELADEGFVTIVP